jgi:S1-C subfamily serine protease
MDWKDDESPGLLKEALADNRPEQSEGLVSALLASLEDKPRKVDAKTAKNILAELRKYARFSDLFRVGEVFRTCGQNAPEVRRQLAQALIENGEITRAIEHLKDLQHELEERRSDAAEDPIEVDGIEFELGETLGLIGRAYKQLYVDAGPRSSEPRLEDLTRSLENYGRAYRERLGDYLWHGVNHVALLTRSERVKRGALNVYSDEAEDYARRILRAVEGIERRGPLQPWDAANKAEALLGLGKNPEAVDACKAYLEIDGLDAFQVQSTKRQFVEVWQLNEHDYPGSHILPMMTAKFAELGGVGSAIDLSAIEAGNLEKVWGDTHYQSLEWLLQAVARTRGVARLGPNMYEGWGSGFLVDGAWIDDGWSDRKLLMTNAHVCTNDPAVQTQFPFPKGAEGNTATFLGLLGRGTKPVQIDVLEVLWTSPPSELDASLLEIAEVPKGAENPPRIEATPGFTDWPEKRVNILGHPHGMTLRVSLQDNKLISVGDRYLYYQTPTDPGSSGSPIFNQAWELVGIHHSASKDKQANEGIRLDRIVEQIRHELVG